MGGGGARGPLGLGGNLALIIHPLSADPATLLFYLILLLIFTLFYHYSPSVCSPCYSSIYYFTLPLYLICFWFLLFSIIILPTIPNSSSLFYPVLIVCFSVVYFITWNKSMFYQSFLFHFSLTSLIFQHQTDPSKCSYIAPFKVIFVKPVLMLHFRQFSYLVIYLVIIHLLPNTNTRDEWRMLLYLAINLVIRQTPSPIYLPQSWRLGFYNWEEEFVVLGVTQSWT